MTTFDIHRMTLSQLKRNLGAKNLSSREITESFLKRISETNKSLNAFITITEDLAISQSVAADEIIAKGKEKSLTGLPFAHKDLFCTDGILTTCASKMLSNFVPPYDATVVKRLKDAGIIMIGKPIWMSLQWGPQMKQAITGQ